jgi:hypothetical protein
MSSKPGIDYHFLLAKFVKKQYLKYALHWLTRATESDIAETNKSIVLTDSFNDTLLKISKLPLKQAMDAYTRNNFRTQYGTFYGRRPDLTDLTDTEILKQQKFSQVPCCKVINSKTVEYLDQWQFLEKDDLYIKQVISTLRGLYKIIRSRIPPVSTNTEMHRRFNKNEIIQNKRFDVLMSIRANSVENKCDPVLLKSKSKLELIFRT